MIEVVFRVTEPDYEHLAEQGRLLRAERNVVFPPGPWTKDQLARYAIQRAVTDAYPKVDEPR